MANGIPHTYATSYPDANIRTCRKLHAMQGSDLCIGRVRSQCQMMTTYTELASVPSDPPGPFKDQLRLAVAAYLARFTGSSRRCTESHLRCFLAWCAERGLDPLAAQRPHLELYIRWMQEIRRLEPSTVCRQFSALRHRAFVAERCPFVDR